MRHVLSDLDLLCAPVLGEAFGDNAVEAFRAAQAQAAEAPQAAAPSGAFGDNAVEAFRAAQAAQAQAAQAVPQAPQAAAPSGGAFGDNAVEAFRAAQAAQAKGAPAPRGMTAADFFSSLSRGFSSAFGPREPQPVPMPATESPGWLSGSTGPVPNALLAGGALLGGLFLVRRIWT